MYIENNQKGGEEMGETIRFPNPQFDLIYDVL